jgi:UDP-N-acetylmuramate--alanine ligase
VFRGRAHRLHFVGIGGIGMSGIAEVLLTLGYDVRGSDLQMSPAAKRLAGMGVKIFIGHAIAHVGDADVLVTSTAVRPLNPEVLEAKRRGIPVIRRAEMLAELMRLKYGIAVAGTHGKTTTTSLVATILAQGGFDPTIVIGGRLKSISTNARLGAGEYLVAEADESDGTFLRLIPTIAVVTNIDLDHLDHWRGGLPQILDAFTDFVNKVPFYGAAILCHDHPNVQTLLPRLEKRYLTYGLSPQATFSADDVQVKEGAMAFTVKRQGELLGRVQVGLAGRHNVQNALASIAVAEEVGVPFDVTAKALRDFEGIARRFEVKGEVAGVLVVDDYGHHPTEIRVTLEAAKEAYARRLVVAFEPHRYSRTRDLLDDFAQAFNISNVLLITDIYAAGESPLPGIGGAELCEVVRSHGHRDVHYVGPALAAAPAICHHLRSGDLLLTLGAGSIYQVGEEVLGMLATGKAVLHA